MGCAVRGHDEPVVSNLRFLLFDCPFFTGHNRLGKLGERMAFTGQFKGFVPAKRCPLDRESFLLKAFLECIRVAIAVSGEARSLSRNNLLVIGKGPLDQLRNKINIIQVKEHLVAIFRDQH